jgi:ferrous iron transport protein A
MASIVMVNSVGTSHDTGRWRHFDASWINIHYRHGGELLIKHGPIFMTSENARCAALSGVPAGTRVVFRRAEGGRELTSRLAALGLVAGSPLEVLQNSEHGPVLVRVHNTRVALGRNEARKVWLR